MTRIAFVDLVFSWPPHGGADVDLYHVVSGLQSLGYEVCVFVAGIENSWERGTVDPNEMPFPTVRIDFSLLSLTPWNLKKRFREAVDAWRPDIVFLADGFFLKPYVAEALAHYPIVSRYYAYELSCLRDHMRFKDGEPCPNDYFRTPDTCRKCSLNHLKPAIQRWSILAWAHEYLAGGAFLPGYARRALAVTAGFSAVIVSNEIMKAHLNGINDNVVIAPGGVNMREFEYAPLHDREANGRTIILMTGRVEDPSKGFDVLWEAGRRLAETRNDFEIWATHTDYTLNCDWYKSVGWRDHSEIVSLYRQADICVVPSIWEEPFGLVAVEAMAVGRPVCASRVGGLQVIVQHGETGFLFSRGNAAELADCLSRLLDSKELRVQMGAAGRARAEAEYNWERLVERHYPPIFESVKR